MEHQCVRRRADAEDQRRRLGPQLENRIAAKLLGLPPMKNLRFMIYDLRLAFLNGCCVSAFAARQSYIVYRKFPDVILPVAKE